MLLWIVIAGAAGVALLIRWVFKWKDPSWDGEANQSKAFLWTKRGSSGGFGS